MSDSLQYLSKVWLTEKVFYHLWFQHLISKNKDQTSLSTACLLGSAIVTFRTLQIAEALQSKTLFSHWGPVSGRTGHRFIWKRWFEMESERERVCHANNRGVRKVGETERGWWRRWKERVQISEILTAFQPQVTHFLPVRDDVASNPHLCVSVKRSWLQTSGSPPPSSPPAASSGFSDRCYEMDWEREEEEHSDKYRHLTCVGAPYVRNV